VETPTAKKAVETPTAKKAVKTPTVKKAVKTPTAKKAVETPTAKKAVETPAAKEEVKKKDQAVETATETPATDAKGDDAKAEEKGEEKTQKPKSEASVIMNAGEEEADKAAETARKKGRGKSIPAGIAFVRSTFNNTIVSIADARGGIISWSSAGKAGFKGSRKSTAFAATMVAQDAARQAISRGMHEVEVRIQGAGAGRESAVRAIQQAGISVSMIKDCTPIPHNGCRPRKRRRV
jgi:small subunit ribosomal protein S11